MYIKSNKLKKVVGTIFAYHKEQKIRASNLNYRGTFLGP